MNRKPMWLLCFAALFTLTVACSDSFQTSSFVKAENAADGVYEFTLNLSDSLETYDIDFYTRSRRASSQGYPLFVTWTSPDGESFFETVYMRLGSVDGVRESYRKGTVPSKYGVWKLSVAPQCPSDLLFGFGVIY